MMHADVLVCGGGPSGFAAATTAARMGARVLLVERHGRLGGMAVNALVGPFMGSVASPFVEQTLAQLGGREVDWERIDLDLATLVQEAGAEILLHAWATDVLQENNRVLGVRLLTKQGTIDVRADITVDATGDGDVASFAGAPFEQGRPGDGLLQPVSIMFRIAGVDEARAFVSSGEKRAKEIHVPGGTWEEVIHRGQARGELAPTVGVIRTYATRRKGERGINATQINHIDGTNPRDLTRSELEGRQQAYEVLDFMRKHAPGYEEAYITAMPAVVGVRETRRVLGTHYLTREDLVQGKKWPDAVVWDASFVIDIHNPDGSGQAEGLAAPVIPYDIPYGCLVPRETDGLLLTGRCISGSHDAHASYRVMAIAMAIGAASGTAAAIAVQDRVQPRDVDVTKVQSALKGS